jgi:hypothetical protein
MFEVVHKVYSIIKKPPPVALGLVKFKKPWVDIFSYYVGKYKL